MVKILFICHGNICRSPMAEYVFMEMVRRRNRMHRIQAASAATSTEEIGRDIHPGTKSVLRAHGIPFSKRAARQMTREDYRAYDWLIGMDRTNLNAMRRIAQGDPEGKLRLLLSFAGEMREVADPWYTGDFETTYRDVTKGCAALLDWLVDLDASQSVITKGDRFKSWKDRHKDGMD